MEQDDYGQIATNLDNYSVPLLDMYDYLCVQKDEVAIDLPQETEESMEELKQATADLAYDNRPRAF